MYSCVKHQTKVNENVLLPLDDKQFWAKSKMHKLQKLNFFETICDAIKDTNSKTKTTIVKLCLHSDNLLGTIVSFNIK